LHQLLVSYGQGNSFGQGFTSILSGTLASATQGVYNMNQFGVNILNGNFGEINSFELPSKELLEVAFDALNFQAYEDWIMDSGTSAHFSGDRSFFSTLDPSYQNAVTSISGQLYCIEGEGFAEIKSIRNVQYVPGLYRNILSVGKIADLRHLAIFNKSSCFVISINKLFCLVAKGTRTPSSGLYRLTQLAQNLESPQIYTLNNSQNKQSTTSCLYNNSATQLS
jgi:hypothetical protein